MPCVLCWKFTHVFYASYYFSLTGLYFYPRTFIILIFIWGEHYFLFTFYIAICNDGDGLLGISRILKLRNKLLSHRTNKHPEQGPQHLFEVSQWCKAVDLLGKRRKITLNSCFGEISGSRGMEKNIFYLISKYSYSTSSNPGWGITCRNDIMLIHVPHGQGSISF
ncbi:putative H(+)-transporting two-sector ATPase [Helianthus debilis subsp. tardiflorus]